MKNVVYLYLIVAFAAFIPAPALAQTQDRRMVFDRYDCNEPATESEDKDSSCLVELVDVHVGGQKITSGKPFVADENWLKNLKVKVKNVSGKPFVFVQVSFGLIEGLYEELAPSASWGWGFGLSHGKASNSNDKKRKISKVIVLKPNEEIELTFADLADVYKKSSFMQVVGKMSQIVVRTATELLNLRTATKTTVSFLSRTSSL
ncbi:MAG: hypothetical protein IPN69_18510 [Acidobacteria bacterium]|nr:hypothetical protein [Acidobacteriota bacterium]